MKLAILTHRFPYPPDRGDVITVLNLLRVVAPRHEVHLLCLSGDTPQPAGLRILESLGVQFEFAHLPKSRSLLQAGLALASGESLQLAYFRCAEFDRAVGRLIQRGPFDCVVSHMLRVLPQAQRIPARRRVFMAGDCLSVHLDRAAAHVRPPMRWILREESRRLARVEREGADWADEMWMFSDEDVKVFPTNHKSKFRVVRLGVAAAVSETGWQPDGKTLLFVGRMDVRHNVEAARRLCEEVLPRVRREQPQAQVRLVGAMPSSRVRSLGRIPGVRVTGSVLDLSREYGSACALAAPLSFSTGVQNKIIEATAAGLPVVTTSNAARGVGLALARFLDVSDSNEGLAAACVALLRNPEAARARADEARVTVRRVFRWSNMLEALEQPLLRPLESDYPSPAALLPAG